MQELEAFAVLSVRRACGFGALAIATLMLGLVGTPAAALETGAVCCLLMALILYWKSEHALRQDHRKTELWMMLAETHRPPHDVAAVVVPRILRRTNPLGIKGAGEAGAIAAPAAVMNALIDALAPRGVTHIDMPATPLAVWQALQTRERFSH